MKKIENITVTLKALFPCQFSDKNVLDSATKLIHI